MRIKIFLVIFLNLAVLANTEEVGSFRLGLFINIPKPGYAAHFSMPYGYENLTLDDKVKNEISYGFNLEVGLSIFKRFKLIMTVSHYDTRLKEEIIVNVPNRFIEGDIRKVEVSLCPGFNQTCLGFGLNYSFSLFKILNPYVGLGLDYYAGNIEVLNGLSIEDRYEYYGPYIIRFPPEIKKIEHKEISFNKFGITYKLGLEKPLSKGSAIFLELKYISFKKEILHPIAEYMDGKNVRINLGLDRLFLIAGLKYSF